MPLTSNRQYRSYVIAWFLVFAGIILGITGYSLYYSAENYLLKKFSHQQKLLAQTVSGFIDAKRHRLMSSAKAMDSKTYQQYNKALLDVMKSNDYSSFIFTVNIDAEKNIRYAIIPETQNNETSESLKSGEKPSLSAEFTNIIKQFYQSPAESKTFEFKDNNQTNHLVTLAAIFDNQKNVSGLVIVEVSNQQTMAFEEQLLESMLVTIGLLFICFLVASIFFARKITRPMEELTDAIERLIENDFNFNLSLSGFGGFTYLAKQFNLMLLKLKVSRNELVSINKAYSRFVPHQVLKMISPNGIKTTVLGDCVEKEMTILFCDIRGFTRLSESMAPGENFEFINRYLKIMAPVINKYGGTIDKYMGDGIMALFPNSADNALLAAIGMMQSLDKYNEQLKSRRLPLVKIGLGLHTGKMILGTVGTSSRMDVTVISDTVNAAARIESLTKTFRTPILISEETRMRLKSFDKQNLRFIASCFVKGKLKPMTIYEVFSQDSASIRKEKLDNQSALITAWECYKHGEVDKASSIYQRIMERSPNDKAPLALIEVVQSGRL